MKSSKAFFIFFSTCMTTALYINAFVPQTNQIAFCGVHTCCSNVMITISSYRRVACSSSSILVKMTLNDEANNEKCRMHTKIKNGLFVKEHKNLDIISNRRQRKGKSSLMLTAASRRQWMMFQMLVGGSSALAPLLATVSATTIKPVEPANAAFPFFNSKYSLSVVTNSNTTAASSIRQPLK